MVSWIFMPIIIKPHTCVYSGETPPHSLRAVYLGKYNRSTLEVRILVQSVYNLHTLSRGPYTWTEIVYASWRYIMRQTRALTIN